MEAGAIHGDISESLFLIKNGYASYSIQCGFLNPVKYST